MSTMLQQSLFTVAEAAHQIGVTDSRIRQICIAHGIGQKIGNVRVLTEQEIETIRNLPDGRKKPETSS